MRARLLLLATMFFAGAASAQTAARTQAPDVIYVPTPYEVVDEMLKLAGVKKNGVAKLVEFRNEDMFRARLGDATVVTLYLLPDLNVKLRPKLLAELKPG